MRVIMLAPPGAGKRHAERADRRQVRGAAYFERRHLPRGISTPDGARETGCAAISKAGDLVPDDLVLSLIRDRVVEAAEKSGGYVLDGFPRTLQQAKAAAEIGRETNTSAQAVVYLDAPTDVLIGRITGRGENRGDDSEDGRTAPP